MASTTTPTPFSPKQLGELLQEKQEPFTLELYLLERGYLKNPKKLNSDHTFLCWSTISTKFLKSSSAIPNCSKIVRAVFNKLISVNLRMKNHEIRDQNISVTKNIEEDRFSSASCTTVFNSCSNSDTEETYGGTDGEVWGTVSSSALFQYQKKILSDEF